MAKLMKLKTQQKIDNHEVHGRQEMKKSMLRAKLKAASQEERLQKNI